MATEKKNLAEVKKVVYFSVIFQDSYSCEECICQCGCETYR